MVDFGNTQMEGVITPEVVRQEPVVDQSGVVLAEGLQGAAKQIGGLIGGIFKANAEADSNAVLVDFRQKMIGITDAVEQGLPLSESRTRLRALYSEYLANNPSLAEDIDKVYGNVVGSASGIGHLAVQGNEIEQGKMKLLEAAATNGWVTDFNNPDQGVQNYMRSQAAANQYALTQNENNLTVQQREISQTAALYNMADTSLPWVQNKIDLALKQIKDGADPAGVYEQLKSDYASARAQINWRAGEKDAEWVTQPLDIMIEDFGKVVNGEYTTEAYTAAINSQIAIGKSAWMKDPEIAQILIAQEVLGENFPTLVNQLLPGALNKLAEFLAPYDPASDNKRPPPNLMDTTVETGQVLEVLSDKIATVNATPTPEGVQEVGNMFTNALRSFKDFSGAVDRPQELRQVMDFLAQEETNKFAVANGGVPKNLQEAAKNLIQAQYEGPLLEAVRGRWDDLELNIPGAGVTPDNPYGSTSPSDSIDVVWDGNGVRFIAKPGFEDNIVVRSTIEGLNTGDNSVAQPLNTLIRARATVEGSSDFKSIWENDLKERLFPTTVDQIPPSEEEQADTLVTGAINNPDNFNAVAAYQGDTATSALAAIESNFDLVDFNEEPELVQQSVMSYANTNFNPVSILPYEGIGVDVIGSMRGTGLPDATAIPGGDISVRFAKGVDTRVEQKVMTTWSKVQDAFGQQLTLVSGFRDPARNAAAGGASKSQHTHGNAIDIETGHLSHAQRLQLIELASQAGFTGIGVYNNNIHLDMGGRRAWGPTYRSASVPNWARSTINKHLGVR